MTDDQPIRLSDWYVNRKYWNLEPAAMTTRLQVQWSEVVGESVSTLCGIVCVSEDGTELTLRLKYEVIPSGADVDGLKWALARSALHKVRSVAAAIVVVHWEDGDPPPREEPKREPNPWGGPGG